MLQLQGILTTPTPNPQTPKLLKPGAVNARPLAPAAPNTAQTIPTQTKQLWLKPQSSANENMFSKYDYIRTCIMYVHLYVRRYTVCICMCVHLCIHIVHTLLFRCVCVYIYIYMSTSFATGPRLRSRHRSERIPTESDEEPSTELRLIGLGTCSFDLFTFFFVQTG